ncbi:YagU family protein [Acinetobacter larvae]|uniref:DUF1440 domain-containing protein n=1 Tax=Acinetobacter larvae TaxID=1789224 RepID=A0A1B2LWI5_9GAMM|nr:DUF1440 domain-containing protein [Acinetobacter larvae]AOA57308.1 hypothetical protein BFG52_02335 [Acinetobacter larvae]
MLKNAINLKILFWATLVAGAISSLVKWGSEVNFPPRTAQDISPPAAHIEQWFGSFGFHAHSWDYLYQGINVSGVVTTYHWLFSFAFAFVYIFISAFYPQIRTWYGALYGILITVIMHGLLIPLLGFRPLAYADGQTGWLWNLNAYELFSEVFGHLFWAFSIEICLIAILAIFLRPIHGKWTR